MASKIVRGSLLIKTLMWRDFIADEGRMEDELGYEVRLSCCPHSDFCSPIHMQEALPLRDEVDLTAQYRRFQSDLERCSGCVSEYLTELERSDARAGSWTLRFSRWLDLGACEHANSPLWHAVAHSYCRCPGDRVAECNFNGFDSARERFEGMDVLRAVGDLALARVMPAEFRKTFRMYPVDSVVPLGGRATDRNVRQEREVV